MIYFNGRIVAPESINIQHNDRGFLLADGLFETMRSYKGKVFHLDYHFERLIAAAAFLEIPITFSCTELEKIIDDVLKQNDLAEKDASLRLTITHGVGPRGLLPPAEPKPTVMLAAFPLLAHASHPSKTHIVSIRRNEYSPLANIKSLSYLDNIIARREAVKTGADEGILLNTKGNVAEACAANIFAVTQDGQVLTPRVEDGILPGITRKIVIELCIEMNIPVKETTLDTDTLFNASEVFLTNSLIEIQAVHSINAVIYNCEENHITKKIQQEYQNKIKKNLLYLNSQNKTPPQFFLAKPNHTLTTHSANSSEASSAFEYK